MSSKIFKAYDIRGIYPKEIDKETVFKIGRALVVFLKKGRKGKKIIIVGRDNRLSSPSLAKAFKNGAREEGADIIDIGISTTPMFYFASNYFKTDGGAMITASHNPKEYNGIKVIKEKSINIGKGEGMEELEKIFKKEKFSKKEKLGKERKRKIITEYLNFNFSLIDRKKILPLKIVIDTANATASPLVFYFKRNFKQVKFYHLFSKLDGSFPNHDPDPIIEKNLISLSREVKKRKADFGVAFDGDADRIVFVDEAGKKVEGDLITALLARIILREKKGAKILTDISSSKIVEDIVKENDGKFYLSKTGHSYIKPKMAKNNIFFGGEKSGHYYLGKNNNFETPLFVFFKIMEEVSKERRTFSEIILPFKKYVNSSEINFKIKDRKKVLQGIEKYFRQKKYQITKLDGIKVKGNNFWFLVRPSNTEPLLRLIVEAKNKNILNKKIRETKKIIHNFK